MSFHKVTPVRKNRENTAPAPERRTKAAPKPRAAAKRRRPVGGHQD
jgi:hypothetical protein